MVVYGHIRNGVVVLDQEVSLPEGTSLKIEIVAQNASKSLAQRLVRVIGRGAELPADYAENHDRYIHPDTGS